MAGVPWSKGCGSKTTKKSSMVHRGDMKPKIIVLLLFFVAAVAALALHFFLFEMRYMWYPPIEASRLWRIGYVAFVALIAALWAFFPSRIMVAIVGFFAMFFPHLYPPGVVSQMGRHFDLSSLGVALIPVALLILATHLRVKWKAVWKAVKSA